MCRARRDAIDASWWEEEANRNSVGPSPPSQKPRKSGEDALSKNGDVEEHTEDMPSTSPQKMPSLAGDLASSWAEFISSHHQEADVGVQVRSRIYEVDLFKRAMKPCYWPAGSQAVLRGTWFVNKQGDYVPLRETIAEKLEQAFLSRAWDPAKGLLKQQNDGRMAAKVELTSHHGHSDMYALFFSGYEIYLAWDTSFSWIKKKLSKTGGESRMILRRGYQEPETQAALQKEANLSQEQEDDEVAKNPIPSALMLAVHGIGQNLQGANIAGDAISMKRAIKKAEENMTHEEDESSVNLGRIEVLPVQWRKTLNLEVDQVAANLMPPGIPSLRRMLHSTAVEVLFYLTPLHRRAILDSVVNSLNAVYEKFIRRNPNFNGKVSIFAHSLGSILCWDILCNQESQRDDGSVNSLGTSPGWAENPVTIGKLKFEVDNLFIAGSPLGCFLSLRGVNPAHGIGLGTTMSAPLMQCNPSVPSSPDGLPAVRRLYNIFHPYDPVAYNLEPLAYSVEDLRGRRQALVELVGGGKRLHIAAQELGDNVSSAASRFGSSLVDAFKFRKKEDQVMKDDATAQEDEHMEEVAQPPPPAPTMYSKSNIQRIAGGPLPCELGRPVNSEGRIDFALQEASLEHQYLAALGAHFLYWGSADVALFLARAIRGLDVLSGKPNE